MTKLSDIRIGDRLTPDAGFSCMQEGETRVVSADPHGELYIRCAAGRHYLAHQTDRGGELVGLTREPAPQEPQP